MLDWKKSVNAKLFVSKLCLKEINIVFFFEVYDDTQDWFSEYKEFKVRPKDFFSQYESILHENDYSSKSNLKSCSFFAGHV